MVPNHRTTVQRYRFGTHLRRNCSLKRKAQFLYNSFVIESKPTLKSFNVTIIDYVQLTLTGIATLYLVYLLIGFLRKYVFPKVPFCCKPCKKSSRVKQYRVVTRQPKPFKPSRKAKNLISEELLKVQPSAPVSNINPV